MSLDLSQVGHAHFVGISGIGMSALARHLLARGHVVSGSDTSPGEQGMALSRLGATVHVGHAAENVDGADLVIVTSAAHADNPEVAAARARGIQVIKRAELLAAIVNPMEGIAVAGTHGKTTTSALIGHILTDAGLDPTILIGGISTPLGSNARVGAGNLVVAEADEYDRSFLYLYPLVAVITNVEAEHLDIYGSEAGVREAFIEFGSHVRELIVACADDPWAVASASKSMAMTTTYGIEDGEWRATEIEDTGNQMTFLVQGAGESTRVETPLIGRHNVQNAMAALVVARSLGVDAAAAVKAIASFTGVARRAEVLGEARGVTVMDDYSHHPSEIRAALSGIKARRRRPLRVIFQPHTYSRTRDFLADFASAFDDADHVYLLDIYPARETDTLGMSGRRLAAEIEQHHPSLTYIPDVTAAADIVARESRSGDVVVTMGAGDVYRLAPRILEAMQ